MANKPWLKKTYTFILVPNAEAKFRKIKLPYWQLVTGAVIFAVVFFATTAFAVHYWMLLDDVSRIQKLAAENTQLINENKRYEQLTSEISQRIDLVEDKTRVLSTLAQVSTAEVPGRGDISGFDERFNNDFLDRELPLSQQKLTSISTTLGKVERYFNENQEQLDYTPSIWPLISTNYGRITSNRGYRKDPFTGKKTFHAGIDISAHEGIQVVAPANGVVTSVREGGGLGKMIIIEHGFGFVTKYGHLKDFHVKKGQTVKRGDIIGYLGNTGKSTGPHLHYEILFNNKPVDPRTYFVDRFSDRMSVPDWDFDFASKE